MASPNRIAVPLFASRRFVMQRIGWIGQLKPDMVDKYVELHANTWPGVLQKIKDCNIQNYSIFHKALSTV